MTKVLTVVCCPNALPRGAQCASRLRARVAHPRPRTPSKQPTPTDPFPFRSFFLSPCALRLISHLPSPLVVATAPLPPFRCHQRRCSSWTHGTSLVPSRSPSHCYPPHASSRKMPSHARRSYEHLNSTMYRTTCIAENGSTLTIHQLPRLNPEAQSRYDQRAGKRRT